MENEIVMACIERLGPEDPIEKMAMGTRWCRATQFLEFDEEFTCNILSVSSV